MNRNFALAFCVLAAGGSGFLSGIWWSRKASVSPEPVLSSAVEPGWHFSSDAEPGSELIVASDQYVPGSTGQSGFDEPDVAWFPEAVSETGTFAPTDSLPIEDSDMPSGGRSDGLRSPRILTPEQQEMWRNQLTRLQPGEADELLLLRQGLGMDEADSTAEPHGSEGQIEPLSATSPGDSPTATMPTEPGRLALPPEESLRPAIPVGQLLPDPVQRASGSEPIHFVNPLLSVVQEAVRLNRANVATIGYRRREVLVLRAPFPAGLQDLNLNGETKSSLQTVGNVVSGGTSGQDGVVELPVYEAWVVRLDLRPGELVETRNPFDVAIRTAGWFRIQHNGEAGFTRCGLFAIDPENRLSVRTGVGLLPLEPAVQLPANLTTIVIGDDGQVSAGSHGEPGTAVCGQIELIGFRDAGQLAWSAHGYYTATKDSGKPFAVAADKVSIQQGYLEQSNVDPEREARVLARLQTILSENGSP